MEKITVYQDLNGKKITYHISAESTDVVKQFIKSWSGMKLKYKTWLTFARINKIKYDSTYDESDL